MKDLNAVTEMLYGPGEPMSGSLMTNEEALVFAHEHLRREQFCLVRGWIWLDLDVTDAQRAVLAKTRRQPVMIYAHTVVYDSARRWDAGDFVRTSPLHRFDEGFLFKTYNTTYVLLGDGVRKRVALETIGRIF
ncbi:DUF6957 family protein [Stutzerimonas stutzeri]|uniref:DUF6957 domain-containing protein n=1 Tax=Stutzerimonas stutzeri TaxID=316 RepID=A0A172WNE9_STUST|nr:hypothetical protein [Stutzerimonas stutzeri]ANF25021.1 hypothetical protein PS273GM_07565 [Stutzerimonas stutzeri]